VLAVAGSMDPDLLRLVAYGLAAVACLQVGLRERSEPPGRRPAGRWPAFLFMTAAVLLVMAAGATGHVDDWLTEIGRRRAYADGWYEQRRDLQALLVGSVGAIWFFVTVIAIWRVPERRRRYLASALVVFTLMCLAGVRLTSLHQIDALLVSRQIAGMRIGLALEMALLALLVVTTYWHPFDVRRGTSATPDRGGIQGSRAWSPLAGATGSSSPEPSREGQR
jgi:hypothetical protein